MMGPAGRLMPDDADGGGLEESEDRCPHTPQGIAVREAEGSCWGL